MNGVCLHRGGLPSFPGCFAGADQHHAAAAGQQLHPRLELAQRRMKEDSSLQTMTGFGMCCTSVLVSCVSSVHRCSGTRHQASAPLTDSRQTAGTWLSPFVGCLICLVLTPPCLCCVGPNGGSVPGSQEAFWGVQQNGTCLNGRGGSHSCHHRHGSSVL